MQTHDCVELSSRSTELPGDASSVVAMSLTVETESPLVHSAAARALPSHVAINGKSGHLVRASFSSGTPALINWR
jgi:pyruvate/2-oxoacid:ferredoxin oxidoreductase alpha subunit